MKPFIDALDFGSAVIRASIAPGSSRGMSKHNGNAIRKGPEGLQDG